MKSPPPSSSFLPIIILPWKAHNTVLWYSLNNYTPLRAKTLLLPIPFPSTLKKRLRRPPVYWSGLSRSYSTSLHVSYFIRLEIPRSTRRKDGNQLNIGVWTECYPVLFLRGASSTILMDYGWRCALEWSQDLRCIVSRLDPRLLFLTVRCRNDGAAGVEPFEQMTVHLI